MKQIIIINKITTPIGLMLAGATKTGICILEFTDSKIIEIQQKKLEKYFKASFVFEKSKFFKILNTQLTEYFKGKRKIFDIPLEISGTKFQKKAWKELKKIPYGKTISYQEQAINIKNPKAVRAIGGANKKNKIGIIIPCHRVIGKNGSLTGYGGKLWRKKFLLDLEYKNQ